MDSALILAGGLGTRLRPLTYAIPKPLLPIGEKPILEIIIEHLKKYNIKHIFISVNYKKELIQSYFQDGKSLGVKIEYLEENRKLGTAGPIKLLQGKINEDFFIINGDVYTDININDMLKFHKSKKSIFTIATKKYEIQIPYGVLEEDNEQRMVKFSEKPQISSVINAGMYICGCKIIDFIQENERIDMPDLWNRICKDNKIHMYKFDSKWVDIGKMEDYMNIQRNINNDTNM